MLWMHDEFTAYTEGYDAWPAVLATNLDAPPPPHTHTPFTCFTAEHDGISTLTDSNGNVRHLHTAAAIAGACAAGQG